MYFTVNDDERQALLGLPHIQQSAYLLAIRPYMDRQTSIVGIKRRISYQSLSEALYIEPHPGIKSGSPSKQQLRRVIKALERAGLISIQSIEKQLILKCLLVKRDFSEQIQAGTKSTCHNDTKRSSEKPVIPYQNELETNKANIQTLEQTDIPQQSKEKCMYLRNQFEKFWSLYPLKMDQARAFKTFVDLNPNQDLVSKILAALNAQVINRQQLTEIGDWIPKWKYPANWLSQESWNDELLSQNNKEQQHAKYQQRASRKTAVDLITESCKDADLNFEFDTQHKEANIIPFHSAR